MAKLLQSALASEETDKDPQLTDDSLDVSATLADDDLLGGGGGGGDDIAKSGSDGDGGPGAPRGDMYADELQADGLDDLLSDADSAPGGGYKAEAVDSETSADSVRRKEAGGEPDHYGHTGVAKLLRGMSAPSEDSYASEDDSSR